MDEELETDFDDWPPGPIPVTDPPIIQPVIGAYHALIQRIAIATREHGTPPVEGIVLVDLRRDHGATAIEVRRRLGYHRSTMSSLLDRLEADGLIVRESNSYDGRRYDLKLTRRGTLQADLLRDGFGEVEAELRSYTTRIQRHGAQAVFEACMAINQGRHPHWRG